MQRFLNAAVRNNAPTNMNKPLPEPLVDPDEGKIPIGKGITFFISKAAFFYFILFFR